MDRVFLVRFIDALGYGLAAALGFALFLRLGIVVFDSDYDVPSKVLALPLVFLIACFFSAAMTHLQGKILRGFFPGVLPPQDP